MPQVIGRLDSRGSATIKIKVRGATGSSLNLDCLIDTGFTGYLSLPISKAVPLGLLLVSTAKFEYADGRTKEELIFLAEVILGREKRVVPVTLTDSDTSLLGTQMLKNKRVVFDFNKSNVRISWTTKKIPSKSLQLTMLAKRKGTS